MSSCHFRVTFNKLKRGRMKNEIAIMCVYSKYFNEGTFKYFNDRLSCPLIYFNS